jgi:prepilin-type processing-associated H-X9-DG protein
MLSESLHALSWHTRDETTATFIFDPPPPGGGWPNRGEGFDSPYSDAIPTSNHAGRVNIVFADGHGRVVRRNIDYVVYCALLTPNGAAAREPGMQTPSSALLQKQPQIKPESL